MTEAFRYTNQRGETYHLHRVQSSKRGSTMYYFAREPKAERLVALPQNKMVFETAHGLPVLKTAQPHG